MRQPRQRPCQSAVAPAGARVLALPAGGPCKHRCSPLQTASHPSDVLPYEPPAAAATRHPCQSTHGSKGPASSAPAERSGPHKLRHPRRELLVAWPRQPVQATARGKCLADPVPATAATGLPGPGLLPILGRSPSRRPTWCTRAHTATLRAPVKTLNWNATATTMTWASGGCNTTHEPNEALPSSTPPSLTRPYTMGVPHSPGCQRVLT
jgi:hypothetical protein